MLGIDYLLPVDPIQRFEPRLDERMLPVAVVPPQENTVWIDALRDLLAPRESYRRVARASKAAALAANEKNTIETVETYLAGLAA